MFFSKNLNKIFWLLAIFFAIYTRFVKLDWGDGFFFQPDENNMASALSQFSDNSLNPHFFAYGQFPLYLGYFLLRLIHLPNDLSNSIFILRFISAIYSVLYILVFSKISRLIYPKNTSLILIYLLIFSPGLIQIAHFGTTETLLCLIFVINIYYSLKIIKSPQFADFVIIGLVTSLGLASKISSLIFFAPLIFSCLLTFVWSRHKLLLFFGSIFSLVISLIFGVLLSPYNLISYSDFVSAMNYETSVATGTMKVFYTNQFLHTSKYLFQLTNVFPYTSGLTTYIFGFVGFAILLLNFRRLTIFQKKSWLVIISSVLVYFGYFGQLYVKWTRFMSPVFFIFPLMCAYIVYTQKSKIIKTALLIILVVPNLYFLKLYLQPDVRIEASGWLDQQLPDNSKILSEAGNVVNLPLGTKQFNVYNFDFYNLDNNPHLPLQLVDQISQADYILVPSRRIYKNQRGASFPVSSRYYQLLFSGELGFSEIINFSHQYQPLLNSENAEETWSVFDQPTIRLFQKTIPHTLEEYTKMLLPDNQNN